MLITFTSDAFENIVMFGDVAKTLLKLMGHSGTVPGALLPGEIPQALSLLEERLKKNSKNAPTQKADDDFEEAPQTLNFKGSMGRRVTPTSLELRLRETGYSARGLREPNCVEY